MVADIISFEVRNSVLILWVSWADVRRRVTMSVIVVILVTAGAGTGQSEALL